MPISACARKPRKEKATRGPGQGGAFPCYPATAPASTSGCCSAPHRAPRRSPPRRPAPRPRSSRPPAASRHPVVAARTRAALEHPARQWAGKPKGHIGLGADGLGAFTRVVGELDLDTTKSVGTLRLRREGQDAMGGAFASTRFDLTSAVSRPSLESCAGDSRSFLRRCVRHGVFRRGGRALWWHVRVSRSLRSERRYLLDRGALVGSAGAAHPRTPGYARGRGRSFVVSRLRLGRCRIQSAA